MSKPLRKLPKARRLELIARRARAGGRTEMGSLAREIDADDLDERRMVGERAGAEWVARHRGLLGFD